MKIHTTQSLIQIRENQPTETYPKELRLKKSQRMRTQEPMSNYVFEHSTSFKGKKEFIKGVKQALEEMSKTAGKEEWYKKLLRRGLNFFDKALDTMSHEVLVQALISAIICCIFRPLTIMALPSKDKDNNKYASAHAFSSGVTGAAVSLFIAAPFSKGVKYAQKNLLHTLKPENIKKMFPHVNMDSIKGSDGKIKTVDKWLDNLGNKFSDDVKNVMMVAKPKPISAMSEETLLKEFGLNIDKQAMKDVPVSKWVQKNGEKIKFEPKDTFIEISEEGMGNNYFSLGLIDEKFLEETFKDLDINTIKKNGKRINPLEWKNKDGSEFMPDLLDNAYISSWRETSEAIPLYDGSHRTEILTKKKETKYCSFQTNIEDYTPNKIPDRLGTKITQPMLDKDAENTILTKLLIWFPDIITRPVVAATTIAMIPAVLKNVFHIEKKKKPDDAMQVQNSNQNIELNERVAVGKAVA